MKEKYLWLVMCCGALFAPLTARAELGGNAASVQADSVQLQASLQTLRTARFVVHEMTLPTGTRVREYVSPAGQVFGVAWAGQFRPDLRQLLGAYLDQYLRAREGHPMAHGAVTVALPGLFVHMTGHARAFAGFAFVPGMVPQGVRQEEIR
jgi:hypothetical protein